jgi:hypothetical protein
MYATSSEHTRVPWAAHSYNIAFSDEIGHFEYCNAVDSEGGTCIQDGIHDLDSALPPPEDDFGCFDANFEAFFGYIPVGGCLATDIDFDGVPYQLVWPGTFTNPTQDRLVHAQPIKFTSPLFKDGKGETQDYSRVAFETDLPRIEFATNPPCQRHISNPADPHPGQDCVNPPVGAPFYPFFTTRGATRVRTACGKRGVPTFLGPSTASEAARPPSSDPYCHLLILPRAESPLSDSIIFGRY